MSDTQKTNRWFVIGDLNAFFGLMFDNLTVLSYLAGILIFVFHFPPELIYKRMFPGTALGVLVGDLVYSWLAVRLARQTGKAVTAMPLGLDTPSTIGLALLVLGPAFLSLKATGMTEQAAAVATWHIGMATMVMVGLIKIILSFLGQWVQKIVPQAGLLGSLAGIGLVLIGFFPLVDIFGMPLVGLLSLGIILYTLVAGIRLPFSIPGVFASVVFGTLVYNVLGPFGLIGGTYAPPPRFDLHFSLPIPTLAFISGLKPALRYLPLVIPFAIFTVVGGINVTESARAAGDDYKMRDVLLTEAVATLIAGLCGGVAQSTPYIGHPAYKRLGARVGYTVLTGIFIGLGGILGYASFIVELIPRAVMAPILIFVALDIMVQSFQACPQRHSWAVAMAFFPTVARLLVIKIGNPELVPPEVFARLLSAPGKTLPEALVTVALGNGFIITAMLWGGFLAKLIDRHLTSAALFLFTLALFTFFGIVHSASPDGAMYLPWTLTGPAQKIPYQFALAYMALGLMFLLLARSPQSREPAETPH